jgi:DNA-binding NarL/FixJ family response regulator
MPPYAECMVLWVRRVVVVDDEPIVASLLSSTLRNHGFDVRTCADAASAREVIEEFDPDGALIDINLGQGPSGLHLGHILAKTHPQIGLVFLTKYQHPSAAELPEWEFPDGSAFVAKDSIEDPNHVISAVHSVLSGVGGGGYRDPIPQSHLAKLTRTQLEILRLAALGLTNAAIARRRSTHERTVEQRLQSVYQALGITTQGELNPRVEAVRRYISEAGVPDRDEPLVHAPS